MSAPTWDQRKYDAQNAMARDLSMDKFSPIVAALCQGSVFYIPGAKMADRLRRLYEEPDAIDRHIEATMFSVQGHIRGLVLEFTSEIPEALFRENPDLRVWFHS